MNKHFLFLSLVAISLGFIGCANQDGHKEESDVEVYKAITEANENYGFSKDNTCNKIFKCDTSSISDTVILAPTWEPEIFKDHVDNIEKISGPTGHGYTVYEICNDDTRFTYINTGVGACNLIDAVLALGQTNCKEIIFIGAVGALKDGIKIGDIMIPEYSICGVGADRYLCTGDVKNNDCFGTKYHPDNKLLDKIVNISKEIVDKTDIKVYKAQNFSVDSIYSQFTHFDEIVNLGCNSIEMETATLFHAAEIVGIKSIALFSVSDNSMVGKSLYDGRTQEDRNRYHNIKKKFIPQIVLKMLDL